MFGTVEGLDLKLPRRRGQLITAMASWGHPGIEEVERVVVLRSEGLDYVDLGGALVIKASVVTIAVGALDWYMGAGVIVGAGWDLMAFAIFCVVVTSTVCTAEGKGSADLGHAEAI